MGEDQQRPAPLLTEDNKFFWEAAREGRLVAQRCGSCGRLLHPPRPMCPDCLGVGMEVVELSGYGSVYSYTVLHHPQNPRFEYPLVAALVDLEEGIRLVTNLVGEAAHTPEIGLLVRVVFAPTDRDYQVPVFELRGSG
ncbi:MAG TPA: Zn-ribbon domain-containing OB-fold protein [Acidimicrobiia bacterium]